MLIGLVLQTRPSPLLVSKVANCYNCFVLHKCTDHMQIHPKPRVRENKRCGNEPIVSLHRCNLHVNLHVISTFIQRVYVSDINPQNDIFKMQLSFSFPPPIAGHRTYDILDYNCAIFEFVHP
jgi:hypothetical protein